MNSYTLTLYLNNGSTRIINVNSHETQPRRVVSANEPKLQKKYDYQIARISARKNHV